MKHKPPLPNSLRYWQSEADCFRSVVSAMQAALGTDVVDSDRWRKLAHVRFVATTLQRFLDRLFATEECEHQEELLQHPELRSRVDELRREHVTLRGAMSKAVFQLERTCGANATACEEAFAELNQLIERIQTHMQKEAELVQACCQPHSDSEAGQAAASDQQPAG